ncbi:hypothetical protein [Lysinibacillus sp. RC79]|uniref:hypothetical protein n=1 Tax=Lysinibacillus sp. RC79 TaxID=3156296 RepID=UPI0035196665
MWKMLVKKVNTESTWEEGISVIEVDYRGRTEVTPLRKNAARKSAVEHAQNVINRFNSSLRKGESPRELVGVIKVDDN